MSVYKIIRIVGSSPTSWEEAAKNASMRPANTCAICGSPKSNNWTCDWRKARSSSTARGSTSHFAIKAASRRVTETVERAVA